ncbi:MAG: serine/threonine protein kinase [Myxococcota bacterium]
MLAPGDTIDRYEVRERIGAGGTAVVYHVTHVSLGTEHALKVLSVTSPVIRDRMLQEGRVQASLRHLNVVAVTDVLDVHGAPGLLMEHIEGPSLEAALEKFQIPLSAAEALFVGIVNGVRQAHHHGLVHRDLKPANVLLASTPDGFVPKVTDFGLAKVIAEAGAVGTGHTRAGVALGTPAYMAPEQIRDARKVDQRADIFALGCILYELVTKQRVYPGTDTIGIYNAVLDAEFIAPRELVSDLPERIENAILGALVQDKKSRIPDCSTLLEVLAGNTVWTIPPRIEGFRPQNTEEHVILSGASSPPVDAPVLTMARPSTLDIAQEPHVPEPKASAPAPVEDDLADILELPKESPAPAPVTDAELHRLSTGPSLTEELELLGGGEIPYADETQPVAEPAEPAAVAPGELEVPAEEREANGPPETAPAPDRFDSVDAYDEGVALDVDSDDDLYPGRRRKLPWLIGGSVAVVAFLLLLTIGGAGYLTWQAVLDRGGNALNAYPDVFAVVPDAVEQAPNLVDVDTEVMAAGTEAPQTADVPEADLEVIPANPVVPAPAPDVPTRRIGSPAPVAAPAPTPAPRAAPAPTPAPRAAPAPRTAPAPVAAAPVASAPIAPVARPQPTAPTPAPSTAPAPREPVTVKVLSSPPTASIQVSGVSGRTPAKLDLIPGIQSLTLTSGDRSETVTIRPTMSGENIFCYSFPASRLYLGRCP